MIKRIAKAVIETLTHPKLLSSKPHTYEGENEPLIKCFVTNDVIKTTNTGAFKEWCYFSNEFDAFISEEGYWMVENAKFGDDIELLILKDELAFLKAEGGVRAPERKE